MAALGKHSEEVIIPTNFLAAGARNESQIFSKTEREYGTIEDGAKQVWVDAPTGFDFTNHCALMSLDDGSTLPWAIYQSGMPANDLGVTMADVPTDINSNPSFYKGTRSDFDCRRLIELSRLVTATWTLSTSSLVTLMKFDVGPSRREPKAPQAIGVIHTDMERGFICAETYRYEKTRELGDESAVKVAGKLHQNGKNYDVLDGDICVFKFNVSKGE
ncbi:Obg-like ATPase [Perkinsus olseni]|uniref:Obg-like ATPase n=1 Tax=Perkinsus olseni TaxID=32597 RepID=A0A7J6NCH8_PEROL|nr:Obg-like ATPase [Perkinsus olseni]KAF4730525.1 Obg-like ATPase [Perkinsus olseni]KAF4746331.1 Obg-like ATPase [Perkinsus olseni]